MKTFTKITLVATIIIMAIIGIYLITPIKTWKKYKAEHPSLFEINDESTPTYWNFCKSYWSTFMKTGTKKEDEITYDGGELPEVTIRPPRKR